MRRILERFFARNDDFPYQLKKYATKDVLGQFSKNHKFQLTFVVDLRLHQIG